MYEGPNNAGVGQEGARAERGAIAHNLNSPEDYQQKADPIQVNEIHRRADEGHPNKYPPGRNESAPPIIVPPEHLINIKDYEGGAGQKKRPADESPEVPGLDEDGTLGIDFKLPQ